MPSPNSYERHTVQYDACTIWFNEICLTVEFLTLMSLLNIFSRPLCAIDVCGLHLSMHLVLYGVNLHQGNIEFIYSRSEGLSEAPITFVFLLMERRVMALLFL